ncbi:DUF6090 family protein [Robiginitalea sp. IMCC43444]|uniref:DUF6090 family protein n=1 Tax=Robiginitalea sp. IMCC43444 TaxID=3459121 RepID=UPI0040437457
MIKFFRRIRQKLLSEGNTGKYLKYAIGEIILVVIGILIALAINNWNEAKKSENEIVEIIEQLKDDLIYNFDDATGILEFYATQESICEAVLFDKLSIDDYRNNELISIVAVNWFITSPKSENLDYLLNNQKGAPESYKPIINAATLLKDRETIMHAEWQRLNTTIQENIKKITSKVSLIKIDSVSKNERFEYMLSNEEYKKMIELYWISAQDYSDQVSRYRAQVMATLSTINVVKEKQGIQELTMLYNSKDMHPFKHLGCNDMLPETDYKERRRSFLLGNLSKHDVILRVKNDDKITGTYTMKPGSFRFTRPEYAGIGGDYTVIVEKLDADGKCMEKYASVKNGYLLIE